MSTDPIKTYFAEPGRASSDELQSHRKEIAAKPYLQELLDSIPTMAAILNRKRQVLAVNQAVRTALNVTDIEDIISLRLGECIGCIQVEHGPGGCGTSPACAQCGVVKSMVEVLDGAESAEQEASILFRSPDNQIHGIDVRARSSALQMFAPPLLLVVLVDISDEKRRRMLERIFFHDIINSAGGLVGLTELFRDRAFPEPEEDQYRGMLAREAQRLLYEINSQRDLSAAEQGDLHIHVESVSAINLLDSTRRLFENHPVAEDRRIALGECSPDIQLSTEISLASRTLGNLTKNALEAIAPGQRVTLAAHTNDDGVCFTVHNPGFIPDEIQQQIFQRSFSTKAESGRGLGTYSIKLLTENYLGGRVWFTSTPEEGTTFFVQLPRILTAKEGDS